MQTPARRRHFLRTNRYSEPGRIYMVTVVVTDRQPVFKDWPSGHPVVQALRQTEEEGTARSLCWVVMPDHIHWLMELQRGDLSSAVARFKSRSTLGINRRMGRSGQFWQKGFHEHALREEEDLRSHSRYIVMNPVRAGLVASVRQYPLWDAIWLNS
ncbi:REP-associated tyrosine transposase [Pseudomonas sp. NPDC090203]|uniref:REP-associated tyrosine transposase n=1 Tax=Pseudomonas sp. NPDC090203 TaxID=3364477 RepID=UPI0038208EC7